MSEQEIILFHQLIYMVELLINLLITFKQLGIEVRFADPKDPQ